MDNVLEGILARRNPEDIDRLLSEWAVQELREETALAFELLDQDVQESLLERFFVDKEKADRSSTDHYYYDSPETWRADRTLDQKAQWLLFVLEGLREEWIEERQSEEREKAAERDWREGDERRQEIREGFYKRATNEELKEQLEYFGKRLTINEIQTIERWVKKQTTDELRYLKLASRLALAERNKQELSDLKKTKEANREKYQWKVKEGDTIRFRFDRGERTERIQQVFDKSVSVVVNWKRKYIRYENILEIVDPT